MKDLIGRKVKGFKFEGIDRMNYNPSMDKNIGKTGEIISYREDIDFYGVMFGDMSNLYPASEIEKHLVDKPKRGDKVLVSDNSKEWHERFFAGEIEGAICPFQAVSLNFVREFLNNEPFDTFPWKYMKPLPSKTKVTKQQIADKFDIDLDNLEIVD